MNRVRGPYTRGPPVIGTDRGVEAIEIACVNGHEGRIDAIECCGNNVTGKSIWPDCKECGC